MNLESLSKNILGGKATDFANKSNLTGESFISELLSMIEVSFNSDNQNDSTNSNAFAISPEIKSRKNIKANKIPEDEIIQLFNIEQMNKIQNPNNLMNLKKSIQNNADIMFDAGNGSLILNGKKAEFSEILNLIKNSENKGINNDKNLTNIIDEYISLVKENKIQKSEEIAAPTSNNELTTESSDFVNTIVKSEETNKKITDFNTNSSIRSDLSKLGILDLEAEISPDKSKNNEKNFALSILSDELTTKAPRELTNKDVILKQIEILEKFANADIKVDIKNHPKLKFIKETTSSLLAEHRSFLDKMKEKAGMTEKVEIQPSVEYSSPEAKNVAETNKSFFQNLLDNLHKNKIVKNSNENSFSDINANNLQLNGENQTSNNISPIDTNLKTNLEFNFQEFENFSSGNNTLIEKMDFDAKTKQIEGENTQFEKIKANDFVNKTMNLTKNIAPNGTSSAKLIMQPEALGKVFVEINVIDNKANINIKAESQEVVKMLEKQIGTLIERLNTQGISTDKIEIGLTKNSISYESKEGSTGQQKREENKTLKEFLESFKKSSKN